MITKYLIDVLRMEHYGGRRRVWTFQMDIHPDSEERLQRLSVVCRYMIFQQNKDFTITGYIVTAVPLSPKQLCRFNDAAYWPRSQPMEETIARWCNNRDREGDTLVEWGEKPRKIRYYRPQQE